MSKRISVEDRLNKQKKESPRDSLFESTEKQDTKAKEKAKEKAKNNDKDPQNLKRQTYYVTEELVDALMMYKAFEDKDISVIVREALYSYMPEEYLERARSKYK